MTSATTTPDFTICAALGTDPWGQSAGWHVNVEALGGPLDRRHLQSWALGWGPRAKVLGQRLAKAINAGKVFTVHGVKTDVHGKTYLDARANVMGRHLDRDLTRLGF